MDKNLENKVRTLISFNRGLIAKPENLEDVKEEFDKYAKVCSTKPLEDNFYMFDCKTKGYYKFSCGEGWYYEGVIFKDPSFSSETNTEELEEDGFCKYVHSLKMEQKECFGDSEIKVLMGMGTRSRFYLINAAIFADALLEYIKNQK